jgi:hypothetical protein
MTPPRFAGRIVWAVLRAAWWCVSMALTAVAMLVLIAIGPIGWVLLVWWVIADARDRRHEELIDAIRRRP